MKGKFLGIVMSLAVLISASSLLSDFNVIAEVTMYGDVDCDGTPGMTDVIYLNKFLCGKIDLANLDNADVNCNGIISTADSSILTDYLLHKINELPYNGN